MNFRFWLATRFLSHGTQSKRFVLSLGLPAALSILGLAIGVASLTVAMAVVSGYEATLRGALIDVFGHLLVVKTGDDQPTLETATAKLKSALPDFVAVTPFITLEAIIVGNQKLNGVIIQGVDPATVDKVLSLKSRIVRGSFQLGRSENDNNRTSPAHALIGKALAKRFGLDLGATFKTVLPKPSAGGASAFVSTVAEFKVAGIVDFGKADYDERTVLTSISEARIIGNLNSAFTGLRVKLKDPDRAPQAAIELTRTFGSAWWITDWSEGNRNLFQAIKYERIPIFLVILIMVIAASFNVASNIFIGVLRRTSDIAILRAIGFSKRDIAALFRAQGLIFGILGVISGLALGGVFAGIFVWLESAFQLLPPEVYKLNNIGVQFNFLEISLVVVTAIAICIIASLGPATRAANLDPVEGLRNE